MINPSETTMAAALQSGSQNHEEGAATRRPVVRITRKGPSRFLTTVVQFDHLGYKQITDFLLPVRSKRAAIARAIKKFDGPYELEYIDKTKSQERGSKGRETT